MALSPILLEVLKTATGKATQWGLEKLWPESSDSYRFVMLWRFGRHVDVRVAFSAVLCIQDSGKYLLIRNLHRPESFAPLGGVYKYYLDALPFLQGLEFRPQSFVGATDMENDLRGFLPRRHLKKLATWYRSGSQREDHSACLNRELREEIAEAGVFVRIPSGLRFRQIRTIIEGPEKAAAVEYLEYRIFEVYGLEAQEGKAGKFERELCRQAREHSGTLVMASPEEIRKCRTQSNLVLAPHSNYLISSERLPYKTPPIG